MLDTGSKTRLLLGLGMVFISICIIYGLVFMLAPLWAPPLTIASAGCWIIYFLYRWQVEPPDYSREFADLAAMINMQSLQKQAFLPFGEWAMEPASLLHIINHIQIHQCEAVVECGSGLSTLIIGALFEQNQKGHIYSLEEDKEWYEIISDLLEKQNLCPYVTLIHAPLRPYGHSTKETLWYDRQQLSTIFQDVNILDVLIVDGPISSSTTSRHPALPVFEQLIDERTLIILDDSDRPHEQDVLDTWKEMYDLEMKTKHNARRGQAYMHLVKTPTHIGQ